MHENHAQYKTCIKTLEDIKTIAAHIYSNHNFTGKQTPYSGRIISNLDGSCASISTNQILGVRVLSVVAWIVVTVFVAHTEGLSIWIDEIFTPTSRIKIFFASEIIAAPSLSFAYLQPSIGFS